VNQTAKPMPIANTPLASQGQAPFTSEGYSRSTGCHLGRWAGGIAPRPDLEPSPPRRSAAKVRATCGIGVRSRRGRSGGGRRSPGARRET
jgi:hypothetical protein